MPINWQVGQRISFLNASGTIRFIGPIEDLANDNVRLGIEWDNPARGKHDGQYKGKRYFDCTYVNTIVHISLLHLPRPQWLCHRWFLHANVGRS